MNKTVKIIISALIAASMVFGYSEAAFAASSGWTDKPALTDYKIGQRLILKARDAFQNETEQEIYRFSYQGKNYENINGKTPVVSVQSEGLTKQQILINAMTSHNTLENSLAAVENRKAELVDINSLSLNNYTVKSSDTAIADFDSNGNLVIKGTGAFYIEISDNTNNNVYIYYMLAKQQGVERLSGNSRIDTAISIAKAAFPGKVRNVVLATSQNFPDSLSGSVLAYQLEAPILLIGKSDSEIQKVLDYIKDYLDPSGTVYILGGTGVIGQNVEQKIASLGFTQIKRLGGANRYETNLKIVKAINASEGTPIVIATGENYPDALSISSTAAVNHYPVILVKGNELSSQTKDIISQIKPDRIFIIGREGAVGTVVEKQLPTAASTAPSNLIRLGGINRFETSVKIAEYFNLQGKSVCAATGNNFPDALAGSIYAAKLNAPILLFNTDLSESAKNFIKSKKFVTSTIFGGEGAVNKTIEQQLKSLITQ